MKFTVGDTVRITGNSMEHGFKVGDECVVVQRRLGARCSLVQKIGTEILYIIEDGDAELVSEVVRDGEAK